MPNLNEVSIDFVTGTVTKIIFHNKEKEFGIFAFKIKDKSIKYKKSSIIAKGSILDLEEGAQLKLYGEVEVHSSYGEQFKVHHYEPAALINATADGFLNFLSGKEFKGIGKKIAEEIISIYGKENFVQDILENPEKLNDIHHLSEDTKQNLLEVLSDYHQKNNTLPEILRYVSSVKLAEKIIKKYEEAALEQVKNHPYSLIHSISGIGFHKADEIAALAGIKRDSEERIIAGLLYNLDFMSDETGNTLIRKEEFFKKTTELLAEKVGKEEVKNIKKLIKPCYKELKENEDIIKVNKFFIEGRQLYNAEKRIVDDVNRILNGGWNEPSEEEAKKAFEEVVSGLEYQLDPVQEEAFMEAVQSKFFILTGGPGTGKTTVIETILQVISKLKKINLNNDGTEEERIVLLAPTGRAAQRMKEQTKLPAKTIHSRLKLFETETDSLLDDSENLDPDLLIIDEFSMVSTLLSSTLFSKIADKTQVIVVGDSDQLPSIGAGQVLADLLQVKQLPSVQLKKTFRQAEGSSIIELSKEVREGKCTNLLTDDFLDKKYQEAGTEDVPFIIQNVLNKAVQNPDINIREVQILTPQKYSAAGYINLNKIAQSIINPPFIGKQEFTYGETIFREGDRVMNTKNDYQRNVTNGDIGYIENMIPAKASESHEDEIEVAFIGEDGRKKSVTYEKGSWEKLTLAYAISIHKSQGSQFAYVICPVTSSSYKMLKRNLIYTAITRVKQFLYLIGEQKAYKTAIVHNPEARKTDLLSKFARYR